MRKTKIAIIMLVFLLATSAYGTTYYVDYELGNNSNTGTSINAPFKYLNKTNINAVAGDTVYIRGGTTPETIKAKIYYVEDSAYANSSSTHAQGIKPENSGASGAVITYSAYPGETVKFQGTHDRSQAVLITNKSYIKVTGINFYYFYKFMWIDGGSYNEIAHCTFDQVRYYGEDGVTVDWRGSTIYHNATHNWVHDNTFSNYGAYTATSDEGVLFELGIGTDSTDTSDYNTIENNHMYHGGHHVLGVNTGRYNVIRKNYVHNESWYDGPGCEKFQNGVCGYRVVSMTGTPAYSGYALLEDNRIAYGAQYGGPHLWTGASGSGTTLATSNNIYRYNSHFANALYGLRFSSSIGSGVSNRVYNNTFYHNGWGADDDPYALTAYRTAIYISSTSACTEYDQVIKNNLIYDSWATTKASPTRTPIYPYVDVSACNHNFGGQNDTTDPKFVNPDITTPSSTTLPDLSLQASSPAINGGTYLTQAKGSGLNPTTLYVDDAKYFQDGTWGSKLARSTLYADWITIGTVSNVVQILSIDYANNKITLASPKTWSDKDPIWLYKKSDGTIVLYGSAPDYGAHEYNPTGTSPLLPPKSLRIVQ